MGHKPGSITHIYTIWYLTIVTIENHHGSQLIEDAANPSSKVQWRNHQSVARMPARFAHLDVSGRLLNDPKKKGLKLQWLKANKNTKPPASNKLVSFCDEFEARSFLNHILYPKPLMFPVIITKFRTPPWSWNGSTTMSLPPSNAWMTVGQLQLVGLNLRISQVLHFLNFVEN